MEKASFGFLASNPGAEILVFREGELWSRSYPSFDRALKASIAHGWATPQQLAHLGRDKPHLLWRKRIDVDLEQLHNLSFQYIGPAAD